MLSISYIASTLRTLKRSSILEYLRLCGGQRSALMEQLQASPSVENGTGFNRTLTSSPPPEALEASASWSAKLIIARLYVGCLTRVDDLHEIAAKSFVAKLDCPQR